MARYALPDEASGSCDFLSASVFFAMVSRTHQPPRPPHRPGRNRSPDHVVFAVLWLDLPSTSALRAALEEAGLRPQSLLSSFHLTVYHARRFIPGLRPVRRTVSIDCNLAETRAMVLVPGGENSRPGIIPARHSLALRITTRNLAAPEIQTLRAELTRMETLDVLGTRTRSTRRRSAFGARRYQPHLKICGPHNGAPQNLTEIGERLREQLDVLRFSLYEVRMTPPVGHRKS